MLIQRDFSQWNGVSKRAHLLLSSLLKGSVLLLFLYAFDDIAEVDHFETGPSHRPGCRGRLLLEERKGLLTQPERAGLKLTVVKSRDHYP